MYLPIYVFYEGREQTNIYMQNILYKYISNSVVHEEERYYGRYGFRVYIGLGTQKTIYRSMYIIYIIIQENAV